MNTPNGTSTNCLARDAWLQLMCDRESEGLARHPELQAHLEQCGHCRQIVNDVKRFQTLLQRGKAPMLSLEQRQSLDDRVRMQAGSWSRPAVATPWMVWGGALAAAAALAWVLVRPLTVEHQRTSFDEALKAATLPTAENPGRGLSIGAVEGDLQVAGRDGVWRALSLNSPLLTGQRLRAERGGRVTVPGRFELTLGATSELELTALHDRTAFVRLRRGEAECEVQKLHPGERFAVMFGGFRASVVGTRFAVLHTPQAGGVQVRVVEGAVRVDAADDPGAPLGETTTVVRAGHRWSHSAGVMSLEPLADPKQQPLSELLGGTGGEPASAELGVPSPTATPAVRGHGARATGRAGTEPEARQILIQVPHQTMPPPEKVAAPDRAAGPDRAQSPDKGQASDRATAPDASGKSR